MIQELRPYPDYKNSGVPWLGDVPEHWDVRRNKLFMREVNERSKDGSEDLLTVSQYTGVTRRREKITAEGALLTNAESLTGYKLVKPNDLVMNIMLAWNGSLGISAVEGIASPAYCVFRANNEVDPWFLHYLFRTPLFTGSFKTVSTGVVDSRLRLYPEVFFRLPSLLPPKEEQTAIVRFLDHAERRIRRFIRVKRQMIGLLKEQKQAIILQAVTHGIDPCVPMKASGMEWIGNVPDHWEVRRVKQLAKILRGKFTHRPRNDPDFYDGPYPFIQTGEVARAAKVITAYKQTLNEKGLAVSKMFPRGTLVMTIAANIGDVAVLDFEACFPDSVVGFVPGKAIDRDYLYYVFTCMKSELLREAPVNTQGNLNIDRVGARTIPVPPLTEQANIVRFIEEGTIEIDNTIAVMLKEAELIREYRIRLITDVVTGKLDVRGVAVEAVEEELEELLDADIEEIDDEMGDDEAAEE